MSYIDFAELKARASFEDVMPLLDLMMVHRNGQYRGPCPTCNSGPRSLVVTPDKGAFCQIVKKGGDQIWLVAHVLSR